MKYHQPRIVITIHCYPVSSVSGRDNELRKLRKMNTEFEQQNAGLSKHIENMKKAIDKLEGEKAEKQSEISSLKHNLEKLRQILTKDLANIRVPGLDMTISLENVDSFLKELHQYIQGQPKESAELAAEVQSIVMKMDYPK